MCPFSATAEIDRDIKPFLNAHKIEHIRIHYISFEIYIATAISKQDGKTFQNILSSNLWGSRSKHDY